MAHSSKFSQLPLDFFFLCNNLDHYVPFVLLEPLSCLKLALGWTPGPFRSETKSPKLTVLYNGCSTGCILDTTVFYDGFSNSCVLDMLARRGTLADPRWGSLCGFSCWGEGRMEINVNQVQVSPSSIIALSLLHRCSAAAPTVLP